MHQRSSVNNPSLHGSNMDEPTSPTPNSEKASVTDSTGDARPPLSGRKRHKKLIRLLTVMAYVFSVSLGAIVLSMYYLFLWTPAPSREGRKLHPQPPAQLPHPRYLSQDNGSWLGSAPDSSTATTL